ncbi:SrfA family protein [Aggregatibacter kilianii]|uniref:SrfA family protein n=1 Tax=Aggregatibacter kilianii TaxID=2025884 RepID=UPI000D642B92|nr:SrfA family protein [Aggregatibacter kilianii]
MLSTLLRTGDIKDYTALGQDGQAVYSVASQLRDTIRLKRGRMFSDYLAIPQRNDQGSKIDWYVPFESERADGKYMIIPWSSATDEERQQALAELKVFEKNMADLGLEMSKQANLKGDQLLFSRLLWAEPNNPQSAENLKALRFPNPEHVYLVNNRPVITFWGFIEKNTNLHGDPFLSLKPAAPLVAAAPIPEAAAEPTKKNMSWLWWLLPLLLLLALLLCYLLGCFDSASKKIELDPLTKQEVQKTPEKTTALLDDKEKKDEKQALVVDDKKDSVVNINGSSYRYVNGRWVDANGTVVSDTNLVSELNKAAEVNATDNTAVTGNTDVKTDVTAENKTDLANELNKDELNKGLAQNELDKNQVNPNDPKLPPADPNLNGKDKNNPQTDNKTDVKTDNKTDNKADSKTDVNGNKPDNTAQQKLQIPENSLKEGKVDFLNGAWNAGGGIQDKTTGKPMRLSYNFDDKGKGQVTLQRGDGVKCVGDVNANVSGGGLTISNKNVASCSDGTTYQLPEISCKPNSASADCNGSYGDNQFPITIKK